MLRLYLLTKVTHEGPDVGTSNVIHSPVRHESHAVFIAKRAGVVWLAGVPRRDPNLGGAVRPLKVAFHCNVIEADPEPVRCYGLKRF